MAGDFIYANGRISGEEVTLLDPRMWQMLISAQDEKEVLRLLGDTWYGRFMQHHSMEGCFLQAMEITENELIELSEDPRLVRGILHRRDVRNSRYIWKNLLAGSGGERKIELERSGLIPVDVLERAVVDPEAREELPTEFATTLEEILGSDRISESLIDGYLDRLAVTVELRDLPPIGPGFRRFVTDRIEQKNFLTAGRSKAVDLSWQETGKMLFEGGHHSPEDIAEAYRKNSLQETLAEIPGFEQIAAAFGESMQAGAYFSYSRECDRYLLELLEKGAFPVFGPSPLAAFVIKREMEISHLRLLVAAKAAGVATGRLQDRLPRG